MIAITITVLLTLITIFLGYAKWSMSYWNRKGLNNIPGTIPFGSIKNPARYHSGLSIRSIYHQMRAKGWRHGGMYLFTAPMYLILDLDHLKDILTKDFQYFTDRGFYYNEKDDPLSAHLFAIGGTKWKNLRTKLTPTFTSGKMKMMFPIMVECLEKLVQVVGEHEEKTGAIDTREVVECFTTNIIASCALGLEYDAFSEGESLFRVHAAKFFQAKNLQLLKKIFALNFKKTARFLKIVWNEKSTSEFFFGVVRNVVDYREKNNFRQNDFIQLLIDMKNKSGELSFNEIAAQIFIFFLGGFETSATTMTFALYEMAANPEVQERVREEVKKHGEITYETLHDLKYMEQVIEETLRKYPPVPNVSRECVKDYKVPGADCVIERGTRVGISIMGIHHDPEYYPEPERFDPERFSAENRRNRNQYAFIPFGGGPRVCIGQRFGIMQTKVGLAALLRSYKFTVNEKTEEPIQFDRNSFTLAARGTVWLNVHKI